MRVHATRLSPGSDLRAALEVLRATQGWQAAFVVTCVGSLSIARLRLAGAEGAIEADGPFEIVALVGTLSVDGAHLHAALADRDGNVIGGHLLSGSLVRTTAELVIGIADELRFRRQPCVESGYAELVVEATR